MSLSGKEFYTRNKELQKYIDRLSHDFYVEMPPRFAQELSRHKTIKRIREMDKMTIAEDRKFKRSIVALKKPVYIRKDGDKYFFLFSL